MMVDTQNSFPERIEDVDQLEELLSRPTEAVMETMARLQGDIIVLGVGGKMGPSLARMARRASDAVGVTRRIIGVARFSSRGTEAYLEQHGVETLRCDLLEENALSCLPEVENVVFMAGMKFGATGNEPLTWAMNCYLPAMVVQRYRKSRMVAFSTGNIYGLSPVERGGSIETDLLHPEGDYAMSCVGRERILAYGSAVHGIPMVFLRLNYACEMRYGALLDIALRVWRDDPIDLTMGHFNVIWQGDANAYALQTLLHAAVPPLVLNVTGTETLSVHDVASRFAALLGRQVRFIGSPAPDALLSNASRCHELLGPPRIPVARVIEWTADWVRSGGPTLDKPTHFDVRDGKF